MRKEVLADGVELYLGDCREILPTFGKIGTIVTDPPYGISFDPGTRSTKSNDVYAGHGKAMPYKKTFAKIVGDDAPFDPVPLTEWPCILWGANNYADKLPRSNGWLCWYKAGGIGGFKMSECELAWSNILNSTRHIDHMWHGFKRASECGEKVLHPTQKPVEVMKWCIEFTGATIIVDPFMGSGSTGVAAVKLGRKFLGIEIEPQYFEVACKRVSEALKQPDMFVEPQNPAKQEAFEL